VQKFSSLVNKIIENQRTVVYTFVSIIFGLAILSRVIHLNIPFIGIHDWKSVHHVMEPINFMKTGDYIHPRIDYLLSIDDTTGIHLCESPLINYMVLVSFLIFGVHTWSARLVPLIFSLLSIFAMYYFGKKFYNKQIGILSALLFSISPLHIYFSGNVQAESVELFFEILLMFYFISIVPTNGKVELEKKLIIVFLLLLFIWSKLNALLIMFLPVLAISIYITIRNKNSLLKTGVLFFAFSFGLVILFLMIVYSEFYNINDMIVQFKMLSSSMIQRGLNPHSLSLVSCVKVLMERFFILLGPIVSVFALSQIILDVSQIKNIEKKDFIVYSFLFGVVLSLIAFIGGTIVHNYYVLPLLPPLSILAAIYFDGIYSIFINNKKIAKPLLPFFAVFLVLTLCLTAYSTIGLYLPRDNDVIPVAKYVKEQNQKA